MLVRGVDMFYTGAMSLAACTAKSTAKDVIDSLGPGFNLIGVNIIVTGASSGIGAEAVRAH